MFIYIHICVCELHVTCLSPVQFMEALPDLIQRKCEACVVCQCQQ